METQRYTSVAVALHWALAILILAQIAGGLLMGEVPRSSPLKSDFYQLHKSFGITILALTLFRLGWRFMHKVPALPAAMPDWQKLAARGLHWLFYALMILTPLVGWAMISASTRGGPTYFFGLFVIPHLPFLSGVADPRALHEAFEESHEILAFAMLFLFVLHLGAAVKHQFMDRDGVVATVLLAARRAWIVFGAIIGALFLLTVIYFFTPPAQKPPASPPAAPVASPDEHAGLGWTLEIDNSRLAFIGEEDAGKIV